jgi:hypothetical protein
VTKINTRPQRNKTVEQRFWEKVDRQLEGCWRWLSGANKKGYGNFYCSARRRNVNAHRFAWELANGKRAPANLMVLHSCDHPWCVNPAHLSLGTNSDNLLDASRKGRIARGERNGGGGKLSEAEVLAIRASAESTGDLLPRYSVPRSLINRIRRGAAWKHVAAT